MFKHSHKARLLRREQTGRAIVTYSTTRWWSKWEGEKQLLEMFGDVPKFLTDSANAGLAPNSLAKLQHLMLTKGHDLLVELAATIDAGEPFVKATYRLQGDSPLVLECCEVVSTVKSSIQVCHLPNTTAVARRLASSTNPEQYWIDYAKACIQPGFDYFCRKFENLSDLTPAINAFKAARLFLPAKMNDMKHNATAVASLRTFLDNDQIISDLKSELATYLAAAEDVDIETSPLKWWEVNSVMLPNWATACK